MSKPAFDPSKPFQVVKGDADKPAFDPSKPFQAVDDTTTSAAESPGIMDHVRKALDFIDLHKRLSPDDHSAENMDKMFANTLIQTGVDPKLAMERAKRNGELAQGAAYMSGGIGDVAANLAAPALRRMGPATAEQAAAPSLAQRAADIVSGKLDSFTGKMAKNATGATAAQASKFADDAGTQLVDRRIVRAGDTAENIADRASDAIDAANEQIDHSLRTLDARGVKLNAKTLANDLQARADALVKNPGTAHVARQLEQKIQDILRGDPEPLISAAEKTKRSFQDQVDNWLDPASSGAAKETQDVYRQAVEKAATKNDPALASQFKDAKETDQLLLPIQAAAKKRALQQDQSQFGNLADKITHGSAATALMTGHPIVAAGIMAGKYAAPRTASTLAAGSNALSGAVQAAPQVIGEAMRAPGQLAGQVMNGGAPTAPAMAMAAQNQPPPPPIPRDVASVKANGQAIVQRLAQLHPDLAQVAQKTLALPTNQMIPAIQPFLKQFSAQFTPSPYASLFQGRLSDPGDVAAHREFIGQTDKNPITKAKQLSALNKDGTVIGPLPQ